MHPFSTTLWKRVVKVKSILTCKTAWRIRCGLSTADEPDLWQRNDSGEIDNWIEVGQPEAPRLRKACGRARLVKVYAFGKSADTWWKLNGGAISNLPKVSVWQFDWPEVEALARLTDRTMQLNVSVTGGVIYVDNGATSASLEPRKLN